MLDDLVISCVISAHREIKRSRVPCGVCGTMSVGSIWGDGVASRLILLQVPVTCASVIVVGATCLLVLLFVLLEPARGPSRLV